METSQFLRRYLWVYLYVATFFLGCTALLLHSVEMVGSMQPFDSRPVIIIDPGHGAPDGGATGVSGSQEDRINLEISYRLEALLTFIGYDTIMTRADGNWIASQGDTIRQKKQSDLQNRATLVNTQASAVLVSIHQNHFPDSTGKAHGCTLPRKPQKDQTRFRCLPDGKHQTPGDPGGMRISVKSPGGTAADRSGLSETDRSGVGGGAGGLCSSKRMKKADCKV